MDRLRRATGDDYMGIGAAPCPLGTSEFVIDLTARSATLRDAATMGFEFMGLVTSAVAFELIESGDLAIFEIREAHSDKDPDRALSDWAMIVWHKLSQWLIRTDVQLNFVEFDHPLDAEAHSYANMFGAECRFDSDASRLIFPRHYLDRRVIPTPQDAEWLKSLGEGYFSRPVGLAKSWGDQVQSILRADLARGRPVTSIEEVAAQFEVSVNTLRRRLRAEGVNYRALRTDARSFVEDAPAGQSDGR